MAAIPARPHEFPWDISHAALLIIDMQNDFVHPGGFCCRLPGVSSETIKAVRSIIPRIVRVRDWARQHNIPVVYTRESHLPDLSDLPAAKKQRYENAGYPVGSQGNLGRFLVQGEPGNAIIEELTPLPNEIQLDKPAQSVFVGTDLGDRLNSLGITHLLVTGVTTQCCVLASYRQASDLGFFTLLLDDCCAAFDPAEHEAAVCVVTSEGGAVGWATSSEELLSV